MAREGETKVCVPAYVTLDAYRRAGEREERPITTVVAFPPDARRITPEWTCWGNEIETTWAAKESAGEAAE
jgi:hypothetical protein